jgi:hypothetical protein
MYKYMYIIFTIFHYIENIQEPTTKIIHTDSYFNIKNHDPEDEEI